MIVLDTNVLSELVRERPSETVLDWLDRSPAELLSTTAMSAAELFCGIARLPSGRRRRALAEAIREMLERDFLGRVVPFDLAAAGEYAALVTDREHAGRPIDSADAQIAAICRSRNAQLATRNTADFLGTGVVVINPWER